MHCAAAIAPHRGATTSLPAAGLMCGLVAVTILLVLCVSGASAQLQEWQGPEGGPSNGPCRDRSGSHGAFRLVPGIVHADTCQGLCMAEQACRAYEFVNTKGFEKCELHAIPPTHINPQGAHSNVVCKAKPQLRQTGQPMPNTARIGWDGVPPGHTAGACVVSHVTQAGAKEVDRQWEVAPDRCRAMCAESQKCRAYQTTSRQSTSRRHTYTRCSLIATDVKAVNPHIPDSECFVKVLIDGSPQGSVITAAQTTDRKPAASDHPKAREWDAVLREQSAKFWTMFGAIGWMSIRASGGLTCWGGEREEFFARAWSGTECSRDWHEGIFSAGAPRPVYSKPAPALLGFDGHILAYCAEVGRGYIGSGVRGFVETCIAGNMNILRLLVGWSMCENFKWVMCGLMGKLPGQRSAEVRFAMAPKDLDLHGIFFQPDGSGYSADDVYFAEIAIIHFVCSNHAELFTVGRGQGFVCSLSKDGYNALATALLSQH